jgi:hypothetical protein
MVRIRPVVASTAAWVVSAAVAVSVGLIALSLIRTGLSDQPVQPLSPYPIGQPVSPDAVVATPGPTDGTGVSATTSPTAPAADQTFSTIGGTVIAACRAGGAYLVGWSPAPGYRAADVVRGPAEAAKLKFVGGGQEIEFSVRCSGGVLQPKIENEEEHADD